MTLEIEHKYLLKDDSYKKFVTKSFRICQGYLSTDKYRTVRVRIFGEEAFITIKGVNTGDTRPEFEYKIPVPDATYMLENMCSQSLISKVRNIIEFGGNTWEIDEFGGNLQGLVVAEIEIPSSDYKYDIPPFVGKDVTNDSRYYNSNLIRFGIPK